MNILQYKTLALYNNPPRLQANPANMKFTCDSWGKLTAASRGDKKATFQYDYFGRMIEKTDGDAVTQYRYNRWNQRTRRITKVGGASMDELKRYDKFGRLLKRTVVYKHIIINDNVRKIAHILKEGT